VLAVTRALGDRQLQQYVSGEPEIITHKLQPGDDFLILASDGVWDVLSSQTAVDIVRTFADDPREAAKRLTMHAFQSGSADNITSLVVDLRNYRSSKGGGGGGGGKKAKAASATATRGSSSTLSESKAN
jgi:serine/threonine protein phosphatase PrpC